MNVEFKYLSDYLLAVVTGEYELSQAVNAFRIGLGRCRDRGYENFLVDYRRAVPTPFATEKVIYSMEVVNLYRNYVKGISPRLRVAYLTSPEHLSSFEPGHDLTNTFGVPIQVFTRAEDINDWLSLHAESKKPFPVHQLEFDPTGVTYESRNDEITANTPES